jgi:hypothetical protein
MQRDVDFVGYMVPHAKPGPLAHREVRVTREGAGEGEAVLQRESWGDAYSKGSPAPHCVALPDGRFREERFSVMVPHDLGASSHPIDELWEAQIAASA